MKKKIKKRKKDKTKGGEKVKEITAETNENEEKEILDLDKKEIKKNRNLLIILQIVVINYWQISHQNQKKTNEKKNLTPIKNKINKVSNNKNLIPIKNFIIKEINSDGNCFYRTISYYYRETEKDHKEFRELIVKYIEQNPEEYYFAISDQDIGVTDETYEQIKIELRK